MANFGTVEREVTFSLGENGIKFFTCMIEYSYDSGDYYTPADESFDIVGDWYDENDNNVSDLIERYSIFSGVDLIEEAFEEFKYQATI